MVQTWCEAECLFRIGPGAFTPAPKVESAFLRLRPRRPLPHPLADPASSPGWSPRPSPSGVRPCATACWVCGRGGLRRAGIDPGLRAEAWTWRPSSAWPMRLVNPAPRALKLRSTIRYYSPEPRLIERAAQQGIGHARETPGRCG